MLRIAICDDDREDLDKLKNLVLQIMEAYPVRCDIQGFASGEELLQEQEAFDLIFLDILIGGENGIEIGKMLYRKFRNVRIIFQTNYGEFCADAINRSHAAFAFLQKPMDKLLVEEQIRAFLEMREKSQEEWISFEQIEYIGQIETEKKQSIRLPIQKLLYFEAQKNERSIRVTTEDSIFIYSGAFSDLQKKLIPFGFEVCSRGILVNMDRIKWMDKRSVTMLNGAQLPLSQRRSALFRERMYAFFHDAVGR